MKLFLTIIFFLLTKLLFAQVNLVPNPSFEEYDTCPNDHNQVHYAVGWSSYGAAAGDYYNTCYTYSGGINVSVPNNFVGFQYPYEGRAYCGFYTYVVGTGHTNYREYISTELISPLIIGEKYFVSIEINCPDNYFFNYGASNNIGVLFTTHSYQYYDPDTTVRNFAQINTNSIITDTVNWTTISGNFIADSAYNFINIGNFYSDKLTTYYSTNGNPWNFAYYYVDMVCVSADSLTCNRESIIVNNYSIKNNKINIFPNPATNRITIEYSLANKGSFELYDVFGAKRKESSLDNGTNTASIELNELNSGLYFYCICDKNKNIIKTGRLTIQK